METLSQWKIYVGTIFSECWLMSSYFWRCVKAAWIKRVDSALGDGHCRTSYEHSKAQLFDAPEYRA